MLRWTQDTLDLSATGARDALAGFAFLLVTIAAHVLVETARDTLFLTDLPAARLPWAYIAIAGLAFAATGASRSLSIRFPRSHVLSWSSLAGAAGTLGFWVLCDGSRPPVVFVLYVWAGVLATAVTVQFWIALGDRLAATARRAFTFVALGGLLGGVLGSLAASVLVSLAEPRDLLLAAAGLLALAAPIPRFGMNRLPPPTARRIRRELEETQPTRDALGDPYVRSLLAMAILMAVATTGIDFLFKSLAQSTVPSASLGRFFAHFYVAVNLLALFLQMTATRRLLRIFGPGGTAAALPSIGTLGAALTGIVAGIVPAALLKGADGVLRHSLHRTSTEVLFVPLADGLRDPARALAGSLGHRGGQALGSLLILGALTLAFEPTQVALAVCALCALWMLAVRRVRIQYDREMKRPDA